MDLSSKLYSDHIDLKHMFFTATEKIQKKLYFVHFFLLTVDHFITTKLK